MVGVDSTNLIAALTGGESGCRSASARSAEYAECGNAEYAECGSARSGGTRDAGGPKVRECGADGSGWGGGW
jgi:hypothetical protein